MKRNTGLAILFSLLSYGAIKETIRIFTSMDADIAQGRYGLGIMASVLTGVFIYFAIKFWTKQSK